MGRPGERGQRMLIAFTTVGAVLIVGGLVLLLGRKRDEGSGKTVFKYGNIEIGSASPSIVLILLGTALIVLPHVIDRLWPPQPPVPVPVFSTPAVPGLAPGGLVPAGTAQGANCCFQGGSCPMVLAIPGMTPVGSPCSCTDFLTGAVVQGTVCP